MNDSSMRKDAAMSHSILVVDDEQDFLDSVRRGLISSGLRNVKLENDPKRAISLVERGEPIDLALIDVIMPGMDGVEVLERIRKSNPETECLMVTGGQRCAKSSRVPEEGRLRLPRQTDLEG